MKCDVSIPILVTLLGLLHSTCGKKGHPGDRYLGDLTWCEASMCLCQVHTGAQVQCFSNDQVYSGILGFQGTKLHRMKKINVTSMWHWCNDLCLCHNKNKALFQCISKPKMYGFISETIGEELLGDSHRLLEEDEEDEFLIVEPESQGRRRGPGRRRGQGKRRKTTTTIKSTELPTTTMLPTTAITTTTTATTTEVELTTSTTEQVTESVTTMPTTTTTTTTKTTTTDKPSTTTTPIPSTSSTQSLEVERLPQQEAVAAEPDLTTYSPPTRTQPHVPTTITERTSQPSTHRTEELSPRVAPVREEDAENIDSQEISEDLTGLSNSVTRIEDQVGLNKTLLLVTCIIAAVAMIGVGVLTTYYCRKRKSTTIKFHPKIDPPKEINNVNKVNKDEAY